MKRKFLTVMLAIVLTLSLELVTVAPVAAHPAWDPQTVDLLAGQTIDVGDVRVWNNGDSIHIEYEVIGGWVLWETHLYVGKNAPPTSAPGQFPYGDDEFPASTTGAAYTLMLTDIDSYGFMKGKKLGAAGDPGVLPGDTIYIAAHAVVYHPCPDEDETAWAAGCRIRENKNWATYFVYQVQDNPFVTDANGTVEWSDEYAHCGDWSVKLTAPQSADYAKVRTPIDTPFDSSFTAPSFYYKISDDAVATTEDIGATWPIYLRSGDTVANGYLSPYPVIHISNGTTDHWIVGQPWAESTEVDWTVWDNTQASMVYSEALWHMETFGVDPGIAGVPAGWGPLSYWTETAYPGYDVVDVSIGLGYFAVTGQQSAYVDCLTIGVVTYDLEPEP